MDLDERTMAISYFILYAKEAAAASSAANKSTNTLQSPVSIPNKDEQSLLSQAQVERMDKDIDAVWYEDHWTEQDTMDAERILRGGQEKCNVNGRHGKRNKRYSSTASSLSANKEQTMWNDFYKQHATNFFKDRHYLQQAFPDEMSPTCSSASSSMMIDTTTSTSTRSTNCTATTRTLMEVGCGVGNALLPLLEHNNKSDTQQQQQQWIVWGLDFSQVAIDLLKRDPRFVANRGRAHAHVWDISKPPLPLPLSVQESQRPFAWFGVADVATLLFCLSALNPQDMGVAARNVAATLKPGVGTLLLRDYGRYDEAQLKLGKSRGKRLGEHFYQKHDGTQVYYFSLDDLERLFVQEAGLQVLELKYIRRVYYNRGTRERRRRVWVHGRFRKAHESVTSAQHEIAR